MVVAPILAPSSAHATPFTLGALLFVGSSVHYAATGALATVPGLRQLARQRSGRLIALPVAVALLSVLVVMAIPISELSVLLYALFCWQFVHYARQNVGVVCLAAAGLGSGPVSRIDRRAVLGTGVAGVAAVVARGRLLSLPLVPLSHELYLAALCTYAVAALVGLLALSRRPAEQRPVRYVAVYLAVLAFPLPALVFNSPYAALSGMTIAHGLQYLFIVGLVTMPRTRNQRSTVRAVLACDAVAVGAVLIHFSSHVPSGSTVSRLVFAVYLAAATAHFAIDATVWKLRDARSRAPLASRLPYLVRATVPVPVSYVVDRYSPEP